jgi:hypothetical protein
MANPQTPRITLPYPVFRRLSVEGQKWVYLPVAPAGLRGPVNVLFVSGNFRQFRTVQAVHGVEQGFPPGSALLTFGGMR